MGQAHAMEGDLWNFFLGPESTRPPDFDPHLLQVRFISQKKKKKISIKQIMSFVLPLTFIKSRIKK